MMVSRRRALLGQVGPRDIQDELARRGIYVETVAVAPTLPGRPPTAPAPEDRVVVVAAEPGAFRPPPYMPVYPALPAPTEAEMVPVRAGEALAVEKPFPVALVVGMIALGAMVIFAERAPVRPTRRRPVRKRIVAEEYGPEEEGEGFYEY